MGRDGIFLNILADQKPHKERNAVINPINEAGKKIPVPVNLTETPAANASILVATDKHIKHQKVIQ